MTEGMSENGMRTMQAPQGYSHKRRAADAAGGNQRRNRLAVTTFSRDAWENLSDKMMYLAGAVFLAWISVLIGLKCM